MLVITAGELKQKIDAQETPYLIEVMAPESYAARHIPTAKNVPKGTDFIDRFEKEIGAPKDAEIIVYCSSDTCTASPLAGGQLERAGYSNVLHYKDGLAGWQAAGLKFEGNLA